MIHHLSEHTRPNMLHHQFQLGEFTVSTDPACLDFDVIHRYLSQESFWAREIPRDILQRAIEGSLCFGVYDGGKQIGFARVVTDEATFAYLCDVFVLESHRGRGLSKWLMECIIAHPSLQGLRRFVLVTKDAHGLYRRFGFTPLADPAAYMHIHNPHVYQTENCEI
jgi:GNAT superfamily N-acetyltransferase